MSIVSILFTSRSDSVDPKDSVIMRFTCLRQWYIHNVLNIIFRDEAANKAPVDTRIRPPHNPTFSSNVQGLLRTKVEGGMFMCILKIQT